MTPKYSIIVPVYNAAAYLPRCIESVQAQKVEDWELILVDDGSKDNSWTVMQDYAARDNRIRCFHKENSGAGETRNFGIDKANGEWTLFVDSDDYIDADYLRLLEPKTKDADLVFIDVMRVTGTGKRIDNQLLSCFKGKSKEDLLRSQMTGKANWGSVRKCLKTNILTGGVK